VAVGLGMLGSPFWMWRRARRTCYALTERRAILWEPGWFGSVDVRSYGPDDLGKTHRVQRRDGGGDLVFEEVVTLHRRHDGHRSANVRRHGFLGVDDVRDVEQRLRRTLLSGDGGAGRAGP
jgi:hypothetical protein